MTRDAQRPVRVAFLWHMHQPDYRDPHDGVPALPWVRLHAAGAYFDMAWQLLRHPEVKATVNLVPVLVDQLEALVAGERDRYWRLARTPARDLTRIERAFIVERFFAIHREHGVRARPRYWSLFNRRDQGPEAFSVDDLRDLQTLFNLAWFGFAAREEYPFIAEMERKGRGFREDEKRKLLDLQIAAARRVLPMYQALAARGQVELTTTPYAHPILPLLIDSDVMAQCQPQAQRPPRFAWPDDAALQVDRALARHQALAGAPPMGIWPAEGAVSRATADLLASRGVRWIATDEAQLFRSLPDGAPRGALYQPWGLEGAPLQLVFRDRTLSDLIGFTYAGNDAAVAVSDLLARVRSARSHAEEPLVIIALDGENPWEGYRDRGRPFLEALYAGLAAAPDVEAVTVAAELEATPATLPDLAPGSWINGDYGIWIGGTEENAAWRMLGEARDAWARRAPEMEPAVAAAAREHLLVAEGSDWFWWFGEPFHSENDADFDALFRARLSATWRTLGLTPPAELERPLAVGAGRALITAPRQLIRPRFAPLDSTWFEWAGAGEYVADGGGAMYRGTRWYSKLRYGFDLERAYVRLEPDPDAADTAGLVVRLRLHGHGLHVVDAPLDDVGATTLAALGPDLAPSAGRPLAQSKLHRGVLELGIPFAELGVAAGDRLELAVYVMRDRVCLARYPDSGEVAFTVPDADFEVSHWSA